MIKLNVQSNNPIHQQIREQIAIFAAKGIYEKDYKLPSVRALSKDIGVNPNTVQRAYSQLENDGVIYSIVGKGSFITGDDVAKKIIFMDIKKNITMSVFQAKEIGIKKIDLIDIIENVYKEA